MFKDELAKFPHGREVIFTRVHRSAQIREKLIKWLCVSCLATLNNSCLFDCGVWRVYREVVHQGRRCLSGLLKFRFQRYSALHVKHKDTLKSVWSCSSSSWLLFTAALLHVLPPCPSNLPAAPSRHSWYWSEVSGRRLPICGPLLVSPSNSIR